MNFAEIATFAITFLAVYVQLFLLITYLEHRKALRRAMTEPIVLHEYPRVSVIVPCWNEETTIHRTIESLRALDYPKHCYDIIIVDDGSTDGTWQEILKYEGVEGISFFHKENGGKHTAVNFGIDQSTTPFISCLDADSFVAPDALKRIMHTFQEKPDTMAVAPSIIIFKPKNLIQKVQKVEYNMGVYVKKMLSYLGAIHVTPGPFSTFRRSVFDTIGKFKKAHNTEDMEIAYRLQAHHMSIVHTHTAHVYTVAPDTIKKLYKQRVRWIYGFIQNTIDYRHLIFRKTYGNFSYFTLPSGFVSITAAVYIFFSLVYNFIIWIFHKVVLLRTVGFHAPSLALRLDVFYINTHTIIFVTVILYSLLIIAMTVGSLLARQKLSIHIISYVIVYSIIAPFWLMRAIYNSVTAQKPSWR